MMRLPVTWVAVATLSCYPFPNCGGNPNGKIGYYKCSNKLEKCD